MAASLFRRMSLEKLLRHWIAPATFGHHPWSASCLLSLHLALLSQPSGRYACQMSAQRREAEAAVPNPWDLSRQRPWYLWMCLKMVLPRVFTFKNTSGMVCLKGARLCWDLSKHAKRRPWWCCESQLRTMLSVLWRLRKWCTYRMGFRMSLSIESETCIPLPTSTHCELQSRLTNGASSLFPGLNLQEFWHTMVRSSRTGLLTLPHLWFNLMEDSRDLSASAWRRLPNSSLTWWTATVSDLFASFSKPSISVQFALEVLVQDLTFASRFSKRPLTSWMPCRWHPGNNLPPLQPIYDLPLPTHIFLVIIYIYIQRHVRNTSEYVHVSRSAAEIWHQTLFNSEAECTLYCMCFSR